MNKINKLTNNCEKCVHYYIDYYTPDMPASCRSLRSPIDSLNIIDCPYFIERPKNFVILSEIEIDALDSLIKHFKN